MRKSRWIGREWKAFERVSLAFEGLGFSRPTLEPGMRGARAMNIAAQYQGLMSERQALAIIRYALRHKESYITERTADYTVDKIEALYGKDDDDDKGP